jgi:hypothetical protein
MQAKIRIIFSLVLIACLSFYAISPFQFPEQSSLDTGSPSGPILSKAAQRSHAQTEYLIALAKKEHAVLGAHSVIKKSQIFLSLSSLIDSKFQENSELKYYLHLSGLNQSAEFCLFSSDSSPPFYSVKKV